jgi:hypothetical protein
MSLWLAVWRFAAVRIPIAAVRIPTALRMNLRNGYCLGWSRTSGWGVTRTMVSSTRMVSFPKGNPD